MSKQTILERTGKYIIYFDNLPDETRLLLQNTPLILSGLPPYFRFVGNTLPPLATIVEEGNESVSLAV